MENKKLIELVEGLIALPRETEWVEFKENNSAPQEIGEYLSALANSASLHDKPKGYLVFGIEDSKHEIVGTGFDPWMERVGSQELENWLATQLEPGIDFSFDELMMGGQRVVIVTVDPAFNTPVKFRGVEYIRVGSYKKKLSDHPEKARKIWSKGRESAYESELATEAMKAQDILALIDYPSFFSLLKLPLPTGMPTIIAKLEEEKVVKKVVGGHAITLLGALLFAQDIEKFEFIGRKAVRVIIYKGNNRINTIREQKGSKGYAIGFEGLIQFINQQLPMNEVIGQALRKEVRMYPELAVRELVANALIHQDLSIRGTSPMVEIFDNRIEITNPGKPLISAYRFIDHSPESRNEQVASLMRRIGVCEERGSGIDKVIHEIETYQLPAPEIIEGDNYTRIIVFAARSLRQMDRLDKVRAAYQHCCLKYVSGELMTNQSLRDRFGIDEKNYSVVSRIIKEAIDEKLIKDHDGQNRSRKYAKYVPFWA
jgi:ATP-dependent DNA helicase RecG